MKSRVAGIVDRGGGLRVVIDHDIAAHLLPGERAYILPRYKVQEPIPLRDIPAIVARVERYVRRNGRRRPDHSFDLAVDRAV